MMNNIIKSNKPFVFFMYAFITTAIMGFGLTLISLIWTAYVDEIYNYNLCLTNECIKYTYTLFEYSLKGFSITITLLTSIATIGGIIVALLNYVSTTNSSALNNHIAHFKIFNDYLFFEIEKRDRLNISAIDIFKVYNLIFDKSRTGIMDVSEEYRNDISSLNIEIERSNEFSQTASSESFRYKIHQERMINIFKKFGIELDFHPRNDFYEIEGQLLDLVSTINQAFCTESALPEIPRRQYI